MGAARWPSQQASPYHTITLPLDKAAIFKYILSPLYALPLVFFLFLLVRECGHRFFLSFLFVSVTMGSESC
jgi:hypothetical protein